MIITIGWWVAPLILTIGAVLWWLIVLKDDGGGYIPGLGAMLLLPFVGCGVLFVWLVYFAVMYFLK